jgi:hypothetical protein
MKCNECRLHKVCIDCRLHTKYIGCRLDRECIDCSLHKECIDCRLHTKCIDCMLHTGFIDSRPQKVYIECSLHTKYIDSRLHKEFIDCRLHTKCMDCRLHTECIDCRLHTKCMDWRLHIKYINCRLQTEFIEYRLHTNSEFPHKKLLISLYCPLWRCRPHTTWPHSISSVNVEHCKSVNTVSFHVRLRMKERKTNAIFTSVTLSAVRSVQHTKFRCVDSCMDSWTKCAAAVWKRCLIQDRVIELRACAVNVLCQL